MQSRHARQQCSNTAAAAAVAATARCTCSETLLPPASVASLSLREARACCAFQSPIPTWNGGTPAASASGTSSPSAGAPSATSADPGAPAPAPCALPPPIAPPQPSTVGQEARLRPYTHLPLPLPLLHKVLGRVHVLVARKEVLHSLGACHQGGGADLRLRSRRVACP